MFAKRAAEVSEIDGLSGYLDSHLRACAVGDVVTLGKSDKVFHFSDEDGDLNTIFIDMMLLSGISPALLVALSTTDRFNLDFIEDDASNQGMKVCFTYFIDCHWLKSTQLIDAFRCFHLPSGIQAKYRCC